MEKSNNDYTQFKQVSGEILFLFTKHTLCVMFHKIFKLHWTGVPKKGNLKFPFNPDLKVKKMFFKQLVFHIQSGSIGLDHFSSRDSLHDLVIGL